MHSVELLISFIKEKFSFDDFDHIEKSHLVSFKEYLQKDKKFEISTINLYITSTNIFLKFIGKEELKLKYLKKSKIKTLEKNLNNKEIEKILAKALETSKHEVFLMIFVFITIGIRVSELKFLTYEAVKNKKLIFLSKGKYRKIFLPKLICCKLLEYCDDSENC